MTAMALALVFGIVGGLLLYNNKNFWYNYDPEGRRLTVAFDYFGEDVEIPEEEKVDENATDDVGDATSSNADDFW